MVKAKNNGNKIKVLTSFHSRRRRRQQQQQQST